jgi:hypothetical protein
MVQMSIRPPTPCEWVASLCFAPLPMPAANALYAAMCAAFSSLILIYGAQRT